MKVLHIFEGYITRPYATIRFLKENYREDEHYFLITNERNWVMKNNPQLLAFPDLIFLAPVRRKKPLDRFKRLYAYIQLLEKVDVIFWHSHKMLKGKFFLPIAASSRYLKKSVWITYARELRYSSMATKKIPKKLKSKVKNYFLLRCETKCKYIVATKNVDLELITELYGGIVKIIEAPLPVLSYHHQMIDENLYSFKKNRYPIILIGHDGHFYNNHKSLIDAISINQNIPFSIVLPMHFAMPTEYGAKPSIPYTYQIKDYAIKMLDCKAFILNKRRVSPIAYYRTLAAVDAAVFSEDIPISLDILYDLLWLGKKVFFLSDCSVYNFLKKNQIRVFDICEFSKIILQPWDDTLLKENQRAILSLLKKGKEKWNSFFELLRKEVET